jgi:hypothetical protein
MKRRNLKAWIGTWLLVGTLTAGAAAIALRPRLDPARVWTYQQCFRKVAGGRYTLNGPIDGTPETYIFSRFTVNGVQPVALFGYPLAARCQGTWSWSADLGGRSPLQNPPDRQAFAPAAQTLDSLYSQERPWFHHADLAASGGTYDRTIWFQPGVTVLLIGSFCIVAPTVTAAWFGGSAYFRKRRRLKRQYAEQCPSCGYQLCAAAGLPSRCPECGDAPR